MVGTQAFHTPVAIEGRLALLSAGNAWVLEGDSTNRRPVVVSGDLDGQVFQLSPDGRWLLFSRSIEDDDQDFNGLWVVDLETPEAEPVDLQARNVVHFAEWSPEPSSTTVAYSTVEPRPSPPGWQANNDLVLVDLNQSGRPVNRRELLAANAGGQYGWWGTSFAWAPDGVHMAYARADSVGVIDLRQAELQDTHTVIPYETRADWAWVPGIAWGHNSRTLYLVEHGQPLGLEDDTASPVFDLIALPSAGSDPLSLVSRAGMFAYPSVSPATVLPTGEVAYQVAFLQAVSPLESEASSYRLMAMDRDGSNLRQLFPAAGEPGLSQEDLSAPVWSPGGEQLAVVYHGDLWIVHAGSGAAQPVTGDGQAAAVDWTP
jgi:Tol biopolymer transport system component